MYKENDDKSQSGFLSFLKRIGILGKIFRLSILFCNLFIHFKEHKKKMNLPWSSETYLVPIKPGKAF